VPPKKYVLDTNCFIDASRDPKARETYTAFCASVAPGLYLSAVVGAELRAGTANARERRTLEDEVLAPYVRRARVLAPSARSWEVLGETLSRLREENGLQLRQTPKSFVFDILVAQSCREAGAILVSRNTKDLQRIAAVFPFEHVEPYPGV
jgi:predicted nucleic acid-binding protein